MTTPRDFWQDPNLHIEAAPYGILVRDTQLKVRGFNHWVQVHLPDPDALAGHPLAEAFPAIAAHTINALEEVLRTGLPRILFPALHPAWPPLRHPFSSRPMQVVRAFPTTQRAGLILLLEDITKRTDYEVTLEAEVACRTTLLREREALLRALDAATRQALQAVTGLPRMGRTLTQAFRRPFRAYDALPFIMDEEERFNLLSGRGDLFLEDKPSPWHLSLSPDQQASLQRGQALWMTDIRPQLRPPKTPVTLPLRSAMLFPLRVVDERPSQPLLGVLVLTFPPRNPPPPHLETRGLVVSRTLSLILHWALLYNQMQSHSKILAREVAQCTQNLEAFVYSVSHDLRTPLRALAGYAQAVPEDYRSQLPTEGTDFLQALLDASERMDQIIEDLLRHNRIASYPPCNPSPWPTFWKKCSSTSTPPSRPDRPTFAWWNRCPRPTATPPCSTRSCSTCWTTPSNSSPRGNAPRSRCESKGRCPPRGADMGRRQRHWYPYRGAKRIFRRLSACTALRPTPAAASDWLLFAARRKG